MPSIAAKLLVRIVGWDEERKGWVIVEHGQAVSNDTTLTVVNEKHLDMGSDSTSTDT